MDGEETDANVSVHVPFLCLAVRLAAVVHESRVVALRTGVDDPSSKEMNLQSTSQITIAPTSSPMLIIQIIGQFAIYSFDRSTDQPYI